MKFAGQMLADSTRALRVLETSHPPTVYVPLEDVRRDLLLKSDSRNTVCEFKGTAHYLDAVVGGRRVPSVAWGYRSPKRPFEALRGYVAVYPGRVDEALLDDELIVAQAGDFYGGWITRDLTGPFKGGPGTMGW